MIPALVARVLGVLRKAVSALVRPVADQVRRDPKRSGSVAVVGIGAVALLVAILVADGFRADSYRLENPGVWITNKASGQYGRINTEIREQDSRELFGKANQLDVLQDDQVIYAHEQGQWRRVEPSDLSEAEAFTLPEGSVAKLGGGTFALLSADGVLSATTADGAAALAAVSEDGDEPATSSGTNASEFSAGSVVEVGLQGHVAVADPGGELVLLSRTEELSRVDAELSGDGLQVSLVGDQPVALVDGRVILPDGGESAVDGEGAKLQLPGDDADGVLVATSSGLWLHPLDGGDPEQLAPTPQDAGDPAQPVHLQGCSYSAWAGTPMRAFAKCGDDEFDLSTPGTQGSEPRWRVNRTRLVLNDVQDGDAFVFSDDELIKANKWDDEPDDSDDEGENDPNTSETITFNPEDNTAPKAEDDEFGARPGVAAVLPVLNNDTDQNNDVLTVLPLDQQPVGGTVSVIQGGQAYQVVANSDAGTIRFQYRISDGQLESEPANVVVSVVGNEIQNPPEQVVKQEFTVGAGASTTYQVLRDWIDPEGDPITLVGAQVAPDANARVSAQPDGLLTFLDDGGGARQTPVTVTVGDAPLLEGIEPASATGQVTAEVIDKNQPPTANNDYATFSEGGSVVVWPLRNDSDPEGDTLSYRLLPTDQIDGVVRNDDGSLTVSKAAQFGYELSDGKSEPREPVIARIRVDQLADSELGPSAAPDVVVLPASETERSVQRTVDLLANDYSPNGSILLVTGIKAVGNTVPGLEVQLMEHRRLRVAYGGRLDRPALLDYTLTDGTNTTTGRVAVVSASSASNLAPVAVDDAVRVRAGDIVSVPVLANDVDPEGGVLRLATELEQEPAEGEGLAFVSGQRVRFLAPERAGTVQVAYRVLDDSGQASVGTLSITVVSGSENRAPAAPQVEARVLAGSTVTITLPLAGVDPDGDSVTLIGLGLRGNAPRAPQLGRIIDVGLDTLTYQAFEGVRGTDEFAYRIVDSGGPAGTPAEAEGIIRVGVAPSDTPNQPPSPRSDEYELAPGSTVSVDPLANDVDPDGDPIALSEADDAVFGASGGLEATADGQRIEVRVPDDETGSYSAQYRVEDVWGLSAVGTIKVVADPDAAGLPPIARDDRAEAQEGETSVVVDVLLNDEDPDGPPEELEAEVLGAGPWQAEKTGRGQLTIQLTERPQVVPYLLTDGQDLQARAVVRVPAIGEQADAPPELREDLEPIPVRAGEPVPVSIDTVAVDPEGQPLRIASDDLASVRVTARATSPTEFVVSDPTVEQGTGAVSLIVSDAAEGQRGQSAVITVPIKIESDTNQPPEWRNSFEVRVSIDPEEPFTVDVRPFARDPEGAELSFDLGPVPGGVDASLDGSVLTVWSLKDQVTVGQQLQPDLVLLVDDGATEPVELAVPVRVIDTSQPLPTLAPFRIEAAAGERSSVQVLEGAFNPFGEDRPLKVVRDSVEVGEGDGRAAAPSTEVIEFTPAPDFVGTAVVTYLVEDAVGRRVPGTVTFTVTARPDPPTQVRAEQAGPRSVRVIWAAAEDNGKPVEEYVVIPNVGRPKPCATNLSCVVDGLTPGETYTFTVTARNERGTSDPSEASESVRPDTCPAAPPNVRIEFRKDQNRDDGRVLWATWDAPQTDGTPIENYEIEVNPPGDPVPLQPATARREVQLTGLTNGLSHDVRVRALNQCDGESDWATSTSGAIPAGKPDAPTGLTAARVDDVTGGKVQLVWTPPAGGSPSDNGDGVVRYWVRSTTGGFERQPIDAADVQPTEGGRVALEVSVDKAGGPYQFVVSAENKAGEGPESELSPEVTAEGRPSPVTGLAGTGLDGAVQLSYTPTADDGGAPIVRTEYRTAGGSFTPLPADRIVRNLTNGSGYRFEVQVCNQSYCSEPSNQTAEIRPYGAVPSPSVSASRTSRTQVQFAWSPTVNGHGRTFASVCLSGAVNGCGYGASGSVTVNPGYNWSGSVTVTYTMSPGGQTTGSAPGSTDTTVVRSITDSFLGGTWTRNATHGGAWGNSGSAPVGAISWLGNGTRVNVVCQAPGGSYTVRNNGRTETWSWHALLDNGQWIRTAVIENFDGNQIGDQC